MTAFTMILSTIFITICSASMVFVQSGEHRTAMDTVPDTTVADLIYEFCRSAPGVFADEAMVIFHGKEIRDKAALLRDLGICAESVLEFKRIRILQVEAIMKGMNSETLNIVVGAPGFVEDIDSQTRKAFSIGHTERIVYHFRYRCSDEYMDLYRVNSSEIDSRCLDMKDIEEMIREGTLSEDWTSYVQRTGHWDSQPAPQYDIVIEIPDNFGVVVWSEPVEEVD